jgi:hypothetical protein
VTFFPDFHDPDDVSPTTENAMSDIRQAHEGCDRLVVLLRELLLLVRQFSAVLLLPRDHAGHTVREELFQAMMTAAREIGTILADSEPMSGLLLPRPEPSGTSRPPRRR